MGGRLLVPCHWGIENKVHGIAMGCSTKTIPNSGTSHGPRVMATQRHLAVRFSISTAI